MRLRAQLVLALLLGFSGVASVAALHQEPGDLPSDPQPTSVYRSSVMVEPINPKYSRQSLLTGNVVYKWQASRSANLVAPQTLSADVFKWKAGYCQCVGILTQRGHLVEGVFHWQNQDEEPAVSFSYFTSASFRRTELPGQATSLSRMASAHGHKTEVSVNLQAMRKMYKQLSPAIHRSTH
jgi:hypothetical protein